MSFKDTVKEYLNELSENGQITLFFHSEYEDENDLVDDEIEALPEGLKFKHVENFGGEGEGDQYWSVYCFHNDTESYFVKFNGWYASFVGSEFVDWSFVEPKKKVVTVYE